MNPGVNWQADCNCASCPVVRRRHGVAASPNGLRRRNGNKTNVYRSLRVRSLLSLVVYSQNGPLKIATLLKALITRFFSRQSVKL